MESFDLQVGDDGRTIGRPLSCPELLEYVDGLGPESTAKEPIPGVGGFLFTVEANETEADLYFVRCRNHVYVCAVELSRKCIPVSELQ